MLQVKKTKRKVLIVFLVFTIILTTSGMPRVFSKEKTLNKSAFLTNIHQVNITIDSTKNIKNLKNIIKNKRPKLIYLEQWVLEEPGNKRLLKKIYKIAKKNDVKLFLVIGKNIWVGKRGVHNTINAFNAYGKYIDGIVLRVEPNKTNIWKNQDESMKSQLLNLLLEGYAGAYKESKNRDKKFHVEFPFWYSDFNGPIKVFSQDACDFCDSVHFLIDDIEKLETLKIKWNEITCPYSINITKRANGHDKESLQKIYNKINLDLTFYSNFRGFIVDSDSILLPIIDETKSNN